MMTDSNDKLEQIYNSIWESNRDLLLNNKVAIDEDPKEGDLRWGISLVIRPEPNSPLIENLNRINKDITGLIGTNHMFLGTDSLHCTVKSLEGFRENLPNDDLFVSVYKDKITQIGSIPKFEIIYKGLFASNSGVYVKGWITDNGIKNLRDAIDDKLKGIESKYPSPDKNRQRNTCHISLAVFKSDYLVNPRGLINYIENENDTVYGNLFCEKIELVRYIFKDGNISMDIIETFEL